MNRKVKKDKKLYVIALIILVLAISGCLLYSQLVKKLKCPDYWGIDNSLFVSSEKEIFLKKGEKLSLNTDEKKWVRENCDLKPQNSD